MLVPLLSLALQQLNTHHVKSYVEEGTRGREREHHVHLHDEEKQDDVHNNDLRLSLESCLSYLCVLI